MPVTRTLSEIEVRCLRVLALGYRRLFRPGYVGSELWGESRHRQPQHYARPAGKLLEKLRKLGFLEWVPGDEEWGYRITEAGLAQLKGE